MSDRSRLAGPKLAALAGALHLACDLAGSRLPWTSPPWLLLDHAGELFRELVSVDRTSVLIAMSLGASAVNGAIAALLAVALAEVPHRRRWLSWSLLGLGTFSGALLIGVYLSPPWSVVAGSLAAGVPRAFLVGWALDRVLPAPGAAPPGQGAEG